MRICVAVLLLSAAPVAVSGQAGPSPIVDVHMHAWTADAADGVEEWLEAAGDLLQFPVFDTVRAADTDSAALAGTLRAMERNNIVRGVISGPRLAAYMEAAPERFVPSLLVRSPTFPVDSLRVWFNSGRYRALGEIASQYDGVAPNDPLWEPYYALAEELDVPVGIHMGMGGPGFTTYRASLGNPLLLEDVLVRHPRLRIWIMHAGYPMLEETIALMQTYAQVYVDIAEINWVRPRDSFHRHLQGLIDAGLGKRILFGSDQMAWPAAIDVAIESIQQAEYLTAQQRRDILCENAARFLRLAGSVCG